MKNDWEALLCIHSFLQTEFICVIADFISQDLDPINIVETMGIFKGVYGFKLGLYRIGDFSYSAQYE